LGLDWRDIEHEVSALLIENGKTVQAQRVAEKIDGCIGLLDNTQERSRIGNSKGVSLGAPAEVAQKQFDLLRQFLCRLDFFRNFARRKAGQDKTRITLSAKRDSFEDTIA
jgi:hypothetical protein